MTLERTEFDRRWDDDTQSRFSIVGLVDANLRSLVLSVVQQIDPREAISKADVGTGMVCQPRVLLGLLTYCYATGIFGSQEIEALVRRDPLLNLLCGRDLPDGQVIRHFRRCNRALLQRCLETTLE